MKRGARCELPRCATSARGSIFDNDSDGWMLGGGGGGGGSDVSSDDGGCGGDGGEDETQVEVKHVASPTFRQKFKPDPNQ